MLGSQGGLCSVARCHKIVLCFELVQPVLKFCSMVVLQENIPNYCFVLSASDRHSAVMLISFMPCQFGMD